MKHKKFFGGGVTIDLGFTAAVGSSRIEVSSELLKSRIFSAFCLHKGQYFGRSEGGRKVPSKKGLTCFSCSFMDFWMSKSMSVYEEMVMSEIIAKCRSRTYLHSTLPPNFDMIVHLHFRVSLHCSRLSFHHKLAVSLAQGLSILCSRDKPPWPQ